MLARPFWCLIVARIMTGLASGVLHTAGFAVIVENVPSRIRGRCSGFADQGAFFGMAFAPALGGVMYQNLGWHAPVLFSIGVTLVDTFGRALMVERRHLGRWGIDLEGNRKSDVNDGSPVVDNITATPIAICTTELPSPKTGTEMGEEKTGAITSEPKLPVPIISPLRGLYRMLTSPRIMTALWVQFCISASYQSTVSGTFSSPCGGDQIVFY